MVVESICIVLLLAFMMFFFMRSGRKDYALFTAPLLIVPFCHTLVNLIDDIKKIVISVNTKAAIDVVALAVSVALMGLIAGKLSKSKFRLTYLLICGGFTAILTLIFIFKYYQLQP